MSVTFRDEDLVVFDVKMTERPKQVSEDMADFWGGYRVEFKIIERKHPWLMLRGKRN